MGRVVLRLECFHDDIRARQRAIRSLDASERRRVQARHFANDLRLTSMGSVGTWVAEVTSIDARTGRIERRFLDGLKDYTEANSVGSRGVRKYYVLTDGPLYEVVDRPGYGKPQRRRYCRVQGDKIVEISIAEAISCLS